MIGLLDDISPFEPQQNQTLVAGLCESEMIEETAEQAPDDVQAWSLTDLLQLAPEDSTALEVKVCFRKEDASRCYVSNNGGCRLYFGKNVPEMSQMLEKKHMEHIMKMFRYEKQDYFGPDSWEQIQVSKFCFLIRTAG